MAHHHMLHFRYESDHWEYLITNEPMKYHMALKASGWTSLPDTDIPEDW